MKPSPRNQGAGREQKEQIKSAPPVPKINWKPGEEVEKIPQMPTLPDIGPDREASLQGPAPKVAPFDAGAIPPAPKPEPPAPKPEPIAPTPEPEPAPIAPTPEPPAPKVSKAKTLKISGDGYSPKDLLPELQDSWWVCEADGKGAKIKFRWREGAKQKAFVFPRVNQTELRTWRKLDEQERTRTILDRLLNAPRLKERPDVAQRLRDAIANTQTTRV